jgi:hypothetical protein
MQVDLNVFLEAYNTKRPLQGINMAGRTPYAVFLEGLNTDETMPEEAPIEAAKAVLREGAGVRQ